MNRSWKAFGLVVVAGVAADQWTKAWAESHVRAQGIVTVIPGFADFRYVRNPGAFFGLGAGTEPQLRRVIFVVASLLVMTLIAALHARTPATERRVRAALSLLAAGAMGNLIDRVRTGEVVDFIHLQIGPMLRWATFNGADVLISAGIVLLVLDVFWRPQHDSRANGAATAPPPHARLASDEKAKA